MKRQQKAKALKPDAGKRAANGKLPANFLTGEMKKMICQLCGVEAATKYVEFYQNIGMLVMRQSRSIKDELCKKCINEYFTKFTLTTAAVGWFGMISMIVTPFFILNNVIRFCGTIGMSKPREAAPPNCCPILRLA